MPAASSVGAVSPTTQATMVKPLSAVTANGTTATSGDGFRVLMLEINETAGGTATLNIQGSVVLAAASAYNIGYQLVSATATPARSVSAISITANLKALYQILDLVPNIFLVVSALAGAASISFNLYGIPV